MIGNTLRRYQPERRYCVADYETTGLHLFESKPWQLAWIVADAKEVYEEEMHYIWFADLKVSAQAAAVTGFDYQVYKDQARPPREVLDRFEERLFDASLDIVGHNFIYDGYIQKTLRRLCGKKPDFSWMSRMIDTNCLSRAMRKGWTPDLGNLEAWWWKVQSNHEKLKTKLGQMCAELDIEYDERLAHDALYDCGRNRLLWEALKWKLEI